ncbi:MAG: hypothetical protein HY870_18335 [Chloroflexi bacterium]|nr:hypothetical protein [Chloroflexota bacterium]
MSKILIALASVAITIGALFVMAVQFSLAAPLAAPDANEVTVCTWLGCKPGAVSYTQDDGLTSCQPELEAVGFRGTFYYNGTDTLSWFTSLSGNGHEIGSHLAAHDLNCTMPPPSCEPDCTLADLRSQSYVQPEIDGFRENQIDPNVLAIEAGTGQPVMSMAYPCGSTGAARMVASEQYFLGARGYYDPWDGADFPWIIDINAAILPDAMLLNSDLDGVNAVAFIDRAISEGKWAIFTLHDTTGFACPGLSYIDSRRDSLWVAPTGEVLKYIKVRDAFRFGNYVQTYNTISFDAGHSLSTMQRQTYIGTPLLPIVFDNPVTLNVDVPLNNGVSGVTVDGIPVSYTITGTVGSTHGVLLTTTLEVTRNVAITLTGPNTVQLQDLSARSDSELGQNLGWLLAMIILGASGLAGLVKANRHQPRRAALRERD